MSKVPSKHGRDEGLNFHGFLSDLQDWELSIKDKDKKLKPHHASYQNVGDDKRSTGKTSAGSSSTSSSSEYEYWRKFDAIDRISSSLMSDETLPDAVSEKELGNDYFKQKKFNEAIECYSRSIAFSPTAVAYANRAMAYLKIGRFQEAEDDCTEALNLDDLYIKAYSRRATSRKELGRLKESLEDAEFAMRLETNNQEIKKQYAEVKSSYDKEILQKATGAIRNHEQVASNTPARNVNGHAGRSVLCGSQKTGLSAAQKDEVKEKDGENQVKKPMIMGELEGRSRKAESSMKGQKLNNNCAGATPMDHIDKIQERAVLVSDLPVTVPEYQRNARPRSKGLSPSVQELAARAASLAMAEAAKNTSPPTSAYQFEVSWRSFSGDRSLQAQLLKATSPSALPHIFKNALSAPILMDIIKCVATFFVDETDMAVQYLENLTKVSRFNILIMCLSSTDKADLLKVWDEVFCLEATPMEYAEILDNLRSKYCLK